MSTIGVSTEGWPMPLILMEGLGLVSPGATETSQGPAESHAGCFGMVWHEVAEFLSFAQVKELIYKRTTPNNDDESVLKKLVFVGLVHIHCILGWFQSNGVDAVP
ncbi:hypothetical protein GB937_010470 [Aspergillus fischeri]|nr:hypothetical protein GB937_010470 [Aspergillus fischeri]